MAKCCDSHKVYKAATCMGSREGCWRAHLNGQEVLQAEVMAAPVKDKGLGMDRHEAAAGGVVETCSQHVKRSPHQANVGRVLGCMPTQQEHCLALKRPTCCCCLSCSHMCKVVSRAEERSGALTGYVPIAEDRVQEEYLAPTQKSCSSLHAN